MNDPSRRSAPSPAHGAPRFHLPLPFAATAAIRRGVNAPAVILIGNALIGALLAAAAAGVLLAKMRPPLEDQLLKRGAAVCHATAGDLQYAVTVGDKGMARSRLERLAGEPSTRVVGAWLTDPRELLESWRLDGTIPTPAGLGASTAKGAVGDRFVEGDRRYALVSCPVDAIHDAGAPVAFLNAEDAHGTTDRLWLLVDAEEISSTVHGAFMGALGLVSVAIFLAVGLQLAIALFVIVRLNESMRQLEETRGRLLKTDKLAALGTLSAGVAHEINNPLSYVIANLEFLAESFDGADPAHSTAGILGEVREAVAEARHGAERVRVIVRDLKGLARGDEEKVAPVDVRKVAESSMNIAFNEIKHRARLVRQLGEVPPVEANEVRLGQVFLNLLLNAAHAIPEGHVEQNEIRVTTRMRSDARMEVEIRDTGVGIAAEHMPKLFDPFFTTKPVGAGTGLGLWVCHGIVTSLGGEILVESEVGRGTAIRVLLPPSRTAAAPAAEALAPPAGAAGRILVVDDEFMVGRSIERLLGSQHQVVTSTRGADALRRMRDGERFDAILCDVMMPEMTGIELFEEIRREHPEAAERVIFITGGAFTHGAAAFLQHVSNPCVEKPFDQAKLRAVVGAVIQRHADRAAARLLAS